MATFVSLAPRIRQPRVATELPDQADPLGRLPRRLK